MPGSRTGAIKVGVRASAASGGLARRRTGAIRIGLLVAGSSPAWAGRARRTRSNNWMLRADEMWIDPKTGRPSPRLFQLLHEICENRLGGVDGMTIPQVSTSVTQTQAEVVATTTYTAAVAAYAEGVAATATATAEVTQSNSLSGSTSIPEVPEAPTRGTYAP